MMRVQLSRFIPRDLSKIGDYIAQHNPTRAETFVQEIRADIARLGENPFLHRLRPEMGRDVRALVHGRYLVLFSVREDVIFVKRVLSGARDTQNLRTME